MNLLYSITEKNNYARHLGASLLSALKNSKEKWSVNIIYDILSENSVACLKKICQEYDADINFLKVEDDFFKKFELPKNSYLTTGTYGRLLATEFFKNEEKILYIDCDTIILKPLEELYNLNLHEKSLGVILDKEEDQTLSINRLSLKNHQNYFNAGVLLLNLKKLRENKKFDEVIKFCASPDREIILPDQDALNIIFKDDYTIFDSKWNYTRNWYDKNILKKEDIGIIHYVGSIKPWDCRCVNPFRKEYLKYLNLTPWKNYKLENKSIVNGLIREIITVKLRTRKIRYSFKAFFLRRNS